MTFMRYNIFFDESVINEQVVRKSIDRKVDESLLSSKADAVKEKEKTPLNNVCLMSPSSIFRSAKSIKAVYLTPEQEDVYKNYKSVVITGPAGSGKSYLILFKILELVQSQNEPLIVVVAPFPHNLRCAKILRENNVTVCESDVLPSPGTITDDVVMIPLKKFTDDQVLQTNCGDIINHRYHLFIDDAHAAIDEFNKYPIEVESLFAPRSVFTWLVCDQVQKYGSHKLLLLSSSAVKTFQLNCILRNTVEISKLVGDERGKKMKLDIKQIQ